MSLKQDLRGQSYDLIDGPIRNHKPLQLWLKKNFNTIELYYAHVSHAFISTIPLKELETSSLTVNSSQKTDYNFNIGLTMVEKLLQSLGLGSFELSAKISSGKSISISYDNSITKEIPLGNLMDYFTSADFNHSNQQLLDNANKNDIVIITGTVFAKNLVVDIETDFSIDASLVTSLNDLAEGKLDFKKSSQSKLKMTADVGTLFPIAVKAHRVDYDKGEFDDLILVTDNRNFF